MGWVIKYTVLTESGTWKVLIDMSWLNDTSGLLVFYICCSVAELSPTLCDPMDCIMPGIPVLHYLLELAQTHVRWVGDAIQPSRPLKPPSPLALNLSQHQGVFQWVSRLPWVPKCWSFSFSISPSNDYSGLISFRIDWFDLLALQGIPINVQLP